MNSTAWSLALAWILIPPYGICVYGIIGAIVGSFMGMLSHRLPRLLQARWAQLQAGKPPLFLGSGLAWPASHCPHCQTPLRWYHNIPLWSFLVLRGKCAHCQQSISWRYPLIECAHALWFAWLAYRWGPGIFSAWPALAGSLLITLACIDWETHTLPDELTFTLLWAGLLANSHSALFSPIESAIIGAMLGYAILWSIYWSFWWLTGEEGLGYGDFKLLAALGAWLGWAVLPAVLALASAAGCLVGGWQWWKGQRQWREPLAFGPFLAMAGLWMMGTYGVFFAV